jgi:HK97 gp10 family phage protein
VRVDGIDRLRARLEDLPDELKDALREAVRESAEAIRDETARTVPRASGTLAETVSIRYEDDGLRATVGWHDDSEDYAAYVEYGTRSRPAQPSLLPALEAERPRAKKRITAEVRRALR